MSELGYKGFRKDELEFQYNPRISVPEFPQLSQQRSQESAQVRSRLKSFLDVPYGNSPRQVVDIYPADKPLAPVLIFIHGGYWRGGSKDDSCNLVPVFVERGATVVLMEYDLCPQVTVTEIVRQTRAAIAWVYKNIAEYGGNPSQLYVCGVSAGGHLTAMALAYDWEKEGLPSDLIKGAFPTSGVYDLDMVMHISVNEDIRMTPEIARENSPFLHPPLPVCPVVVAVGGAEPAGWKQISRDFFKLCVEEGVECEYLEVPGANHFTLSNHLANPQSPLTRLILNQMNLTLEETNQFSLHSGAL